MIKGSSPAELDEIMKEESDLDIKPILPPIPNPEHLGKGKKRKAESAKPDENRSLLGFPDPGASGDELVQEWSRVPQGLADLKLNSGETLRYGVGMVSQALAVLVSGIRTSDQVAKEVELKNDDLQELRAKNIDLARMLRDKDARCTDLKTKLDGSQVLVNDLMSEVKEQRAALEEFEQREKDNAQYFYQYGRVKAIQEPESARAAWDLVAEEAKLQAMCKIATEGEVNSAQAAESSATPDADPADPVDP